jgi:hypothetical protein
MKNFKRAMMAGLSCLLLAGCAQSVAPVEPQKVDPRIEGHTGIGNSAPYALLSVGPDSVPVFNPNELLQISKNGDAYMTIKDGAGVALFGTTAGTPFVGTQNNSDLTVRTANGEKMRVTAQGRVGIGTSSPAATLDVNGGIRLSAGGDCGPPTAGVLSYAEGKLRLCDGTSWKALVVEKDKPAKKTK